MAFYIITVQLEILASKSTRHDVVLTSLLRSGEEMDDLEKNGWFLNDAEGTQDERKRERERERDEGRKEKIDD